MFSATTKSLPFEIRLTHFSATLYFIEKPVNLTGLRNTELKWVKDLIQKQQTNQISRNNLLVIGNISEPTYHKCFRQMYHCLAIHKSLLCQCSLK